MRSLRGRLTLGVVLVLAAVLTVAGRARLPLRGLLRARRVRRPASERTAQLSAATALDAVQNGLPEQRPPARRRRWRRPRARCGSSSGQTVLLDTGAPPPTAPAPPARPAHVQGGGMRYRAYMTTLRDPDLGGLARLEVVSSLRAARGAPVASWTAGSPPSARSRSRSRPPATWLAAELVLRPVRRLRALASSIADDEDLEPPGARGRRPAELRSLARELQRDARAARPLDRGPRARAGRDAPLRRRRGPRAAHAADERPGDARRARRHPELPDERRAAMLGDAATEQRRLVDLLDGLQALARGDARRAEHSRSISPRSPTRPSSRPPRAIPGVRCGRAARGAVVVSGWEPGLRMLVDNLVENAAVHGRDGGGSASRCRGRSGPARRRRRRRRPGGRARADLRAVRPRRHRRSRGSGLGLALATSRPVTTAAIAVGDSPLGGARFSVRF